MPRVKIQLADNIKRVVVVDTEATRGATIGTNVYNADGSLYVPASGGGGSGNFRAGYGILFQGGNPKTISVNRAADFAWQGQHSWEKPLWVPHGTASLPSVAWSDDQDTGPYRVGANNYGISTGGVLRWDVDTARVQQTLPHHISTNVASADTFYPVLRFYNSASGNHGGLSLDLVDGSPTGDDLGVQLGLWSRGNVASGVPPTGAYGFTLVSEGHSTSAAFFEIRRYHNTTSPTTALRIASNASQILVPQGSASAPALGFLGDDNTGIYSGAADVIRMAAGGVQIMGADAASWTQLVNTRFQSGSAGTPGISFQGDQDTGIVRIGPDDFGLSAGGTTRFRVTTTGLTGSVPYLGPNGAASAPAFSFSGDTNNGWFYVTTDTIAESTNSTERRRINASGAWGLAGANFGTANTQAIVSGGASAAPSWQTVLVDGQTQTLGGAKTWSALHRFARTGGGAAVVFETTTDTGVFATIVRNGTAVGDFGSGDAVLSGGSAGDFGFASRAGNLILAYSSGARAAISAGAAGFDYGNSTDNPPHTFYGAMHYASSLQNFADDTAAAAGGIAVNQLYRNGSVVMIRVS